MEIIGINKSLSNSALFEHTCLQNIKKLYKYARKCDNQKKFKDIIEAAMVSNSLGFTNKNPISPTTPKKVNKKSARKSLCIFTNILYVKNKTSICRVGGAKSKHKEIKAENTPWLLKPKRKLNSRKMII